jgi:hypothetical protein
MVSDFLMKNSFTAMELRELFEENLEKLVLESSILIYLILIAPNLNKY